MSNLFLILEDLGQIMQQLQELREMVKHLRQELEDFLLLLNVQELKAKGEQVQSLIASIGSTKIY